jgi:dTDP-glucose pyrophosphorylase
MRRVNLIPMAGEGKRFVDKGFLIPKPFIKIYDQYMFLKSALTLPPADLWVFVCLKKHLEKYPIEHELKLNFQNYKIIALDNLLNGQLSSCLTAEEIILKDDFLTIGTSDCSVDYKLSEYNSIISSSDAVIWTFKNSNIIMRNPLMYGYVRLDTNKYVTKVSCKKLISDKPYNDHAITGIFTFKKADTFFKASKKTISDNRKINNEFYIDIVLDVAIEMGYKVRENLVNNFLCWGTPEELEYFLKDK